MENLFSLLSSIEDVKDKERPPIHLWQPDIVKDIDLTIRRNGDWYYEGSIIKRQRLVHLFASVLKREQDGDYYLITPVEKCRIVVEDVPFLFLLMEVEGKGKEQRLSLTSNTGEQVTISKDSPLFFRQDSQSDVMIPYVTIRDGLVGKLNRNVYYQLAELLVSNEIDGEEQFGIWSCGHFMVFPSE